MQISLTGAGLSKLQVSPKPSREVATECPGQTSFDSLQIIINIDPFRPIHGTGTGSRSTVARYPIFLKRDLVSEGQLWLKAEQSKRSRDGLHSSCFPSKVNPEISALGCLPSYKFYKALSKDDIIKATLKRIAFLQDKWNRQEDIPPEELRSRPDELFRICCMHFALLTQLHDFLILTLYSASNEHLERREKYITITEIFVLSFIGRLLEEKVTIHPYLLVGEIDLVVSLAVQTPASRNKGWLGLLKKIMQKI